MNRPVITDFMGDGFTLNKAHNQYLENLELWGYVQALDKYADDLEDKLSERQTPDKTNDTDKGEVLNIPLVSNSAGLQREPSVCRHCGHIKAEHSLYAYLCPDRFNTFKAN